jgi:Uma2 family endonuclease
MGDLSYGPLKLTFQEYLKLEEISEGRRELISGQARLLPGGTERHDLVTQLLNVALLHAFRGGSCRVFTHSRKLLISQVGNMYYPDLLVSCSRDAHRHYEVDARFVIEVISPTDPPGDLDDYRLLPSIEAIVVVDPDERVATVHERRLTEWTERQVAAGVVTLGPAHLNLEEIFAEVDVTAVAG